MKIQRVAIRCEHGLHARLAAQVVKVARGHNAIVTIRCRDCGKANACSMIELLTLGAQRGVEVEIEAEGADEDAALRAVAEIFENGGGI